MILTSGNTAHSAQATNRFSPYSVQETQANASADASGTALPLLPLLTESSRERSALASTFNAIAQAKTIEDLKAQTRRALSLFLPCEHFVFTSGRVKADRIFVSHLAYANTISDDYLNSVVGKDGDTPPLSMDLIRHCGRPKFTTIDRLEQSVDRVRAEVFRRNGIANIAWLVLPGLQRDTFTGYFFQNVSNAIRNDIKLRMIMMVPYLHIALNRLLDSQRKSRTAVQEKKHTQYISVLSSREAEISLWVARGKTNWEIGQILGISEKTVKTHVQNILYKLRASRRTQVAALFSDE